MTTYLQNLSETSRLLLKEGSIEVKSGESVPIGKLDVDAGTFDDVINKGLAKLHFDLKTAPKPLYPPKEMEIQSHWATSGMTADQASAYLASQNKDAQPQVPGKVTGFGQR